MAEPEQVVEAIQADAAGQVAEAALAGDSVIAAEVAQVGDDLADHAELSEERHEEILEAGSWVGQRVNDVLQSLQSLSTSMAALQAQLSSQAQGTAANLQLLQTMLENRLPPLQVSTPSTPVESSETIVVVEPEGNLEDQKEPEAKTPPKRKRRII